MEKNYTSYCGLDCNECSYKVSQGCGGCIATGGTPFWANGDSVKCEVAECNKAEGRGFCGECGKFPCEILNRFAYDEEQGDDGKRIENCKVIKARLVKEARDGIDPIGVCGHHCDYCFMGQWCGSCRSNYNCCSFAVLFEDKKCPNVSCADEKGLDGCYDCLELENCTVGYYGNENEYAAKATAIYIKKYGKEKYTETLKKAIEGGMEYAKDLDGCGSVEKAVELLEKWG